MPSYNERQADLPPHCGNCAYLNWEEDSCSCTHPNFIEDDVIIEQLFEISEAETEDEAAGCAQCVFEDYIADQDWQMYDRVCDLHTPKSVTTPPFKLFEDRVVKLWEQHRSPG